VVCATSVQPARAQTPSAPDHRSGALKVFLDCPSCDEDFLRTEITFVNYVRDRQDADVHILITTQPTGGGGIEYAVQFIGRARFSGVDQALKYAAPDTSTADERRRAVAEMLKRGLVRYAAETPLADRIKIVFAPEPPATGGKPASDDPWNLWVFRTTFSGTFNGERSNSGRSIRLAVSANRISEEWKVSVSSAASYRSDSFEVVEGETFQSITREFGFNALTVKSLDDHWSAGLVTNASSSTFLNYDFKIRIGSGVEYNIFPYSESTRRLLTVQYTVGLNAFDYRMETIFGKSSERLMDHRPGVVFTMVEPWGSAGAELTLTQYLTKPDKYNVSVLGQTNVRLARGFSLNTFISASRTEDQLYLPKSEATIEEILVRERQLATSYRYSFVVGFTYTFGSIFNNVVNPRFGSAAEDF
jgi:hypothetical protein